MKILIAEDETELQKSIATYLERDGNVCEMASDYHEALYKIDLYEYDLLVLDINLITGSGLDILKLLKRNRSETPTIIISANNSLDDKLEGLDLGADDYLTKPASMLELMARIRAHLRRSRGFELSHKLEYQGIVMDAEAHEVLIDDEALSLSLTEFKLLKLFLQNPNKLLGREHILNHIWGRNTFVEDRTVDVHILRLRKALKKQGRDKWIQTVRGVGYKLTS